MDTNLTPLLYSEETGETYDLDEIEFLTLGNYVGLYKSTGYPRKIEMWSLPLSPLQKAIIKVAYEFNRVK